MTVPMFADDPNELCAFPGPIPDEYREPIATGIWHNDTTIRSLQYFLEFEPAGWIPYVTPKPLLMIIGEQYAHQVLQRGRLPAAFGDQPVRIREREQDVCIGSLDQPRSFPPARRH